MIVCATCSAWAVWADTHWAPDTTSVWVLGRGKAQHPDTLSVWVLGQGTAPPMPTSFIRFADPEGAQESGDVCETQNSFEALGSERKPEPQRCCPLTPWAHKGGCPVEDKGELT